MIDLRLVFVLDPAALNGRDPAAVAAAARRGGATMVQLRDKRGDARAITALARALVIACGDRVPLIVNDRPDIAFAARAGGVHLGLEDPAPADARRMLGPQAIIGATVHDAAEASATAAEPADYFGVGPAFGTTSKPNARAPIGAEGIAALTAALRRHRPHTPVCAIGGVTPETAAVMIAAGADGVAVSAAIGRADDPQRAAEALRSTVDRALEAQP